MEKKIRLVGMNIIFEDGYYFLPFRQCTHFLLDFSHHWIAKTYFFYPINFLVKFTTKQNYEKTAFRMPSK